ncbi:MAG: type II toxin-antitoxin system VapC family toxin, partial [bacterium]
MEYLADTVALILHVGKEKRIGKKAQEILSAADCGTHRIFISCISFMEIMYLSEKGRISFDLEKIIQFVNSVDNYLEVPITGQIVSQARSIDDVPELHD